MNKYFYFILTVLIISITGCAAERRNMNGICRLGINTCDGLYAFFLDDVLLAEGNAEFDLKGSTKEMTTVDKNHFKVDVGFFLMEEDHNWFFRKCSAEEASLELLGAMLTKDFMDYSLDRVPLLVSVDREAPCLAVFGETPGRSHGRIDIQKLEVGDYDSSSLSGGYILEVVSFQEVSAGDTILYSRHGYLLKVNYPNRINSLQLRYLESYLLAMDTSMNADVLNNPANGLSSTLDINSFSRWIIALELFEMEPGDFNPLLVKNNSAKLATGPMKDFRASRLLKKGIEHGLLFRNVKPFSLLFTCIEFKKKIAEDWQLLRAGKLSDEALYHAAAIIACEYSAGYRIENSLFLFYQRIMARAYVLDKVFSQL